MRCIARLLLAIFSVVLGWLITTPTDGAAAAPVVVETAYVYDTTHHSVPCLSATSERGPPDTTYDYTASGSTVDAKSNGTSTRPQPAATLTFTTYDHGARSAQLDNGRATSGTAADARRGRLRPVSAASVAAKSLPTLEIDAGRMPNIAKNIQSALDEGHPGILSRTTDNSLIRSNRAAACEGFCGPGSPDEYPFASTLQGGAGARVAGVPIGEQRIQGGVLSSFYQKYGIGEGDFFRVIVRGLE